jgi:hypothetical protein
MNIVEETLKIENARDNLAKINAMLVYNQEKELEHEKAILKEYEANLNKEQKELAKLDEGSDAYNTQLERVQEASLIVALNKETIAQYEMNLLELK